jgi:flagellar biogenesis protein FliO
VTSWYGAVLVVAVLTALAWRLRRARPAARRLDVIESASLGQGRTVAVVRAGSKRLLVGVSGQAIATLAELDPADWQPAESEGA